MPIIKSAKKRVRIAAKAYARNNQTTSEYKTAMKKVKDLVKEGKTKEAAEILCVAYKTIDMAAKKNVIHKNNAARKKSSLAKLIAPSKK